MAKRTLEVALAAGQEVNGIADAQTHKKARKEKNLQSAESLDTPTGGTVSIAKKSKKRKEKQEEVNGQEPAKESELEPSDEAAKAAKAERKASRKAKKEAKEGASPTGPVDDSLENGAAVSKPAEPESKEARRAARSARKDEKARLKGLKNQKELLQENASTGAAPAHANGVSNGTSKLHTESLQPASGSGPEEGYVQHPSLTALPETTINGYLASNFITITDPTDRNPANRPITEFKHLPAMPKEWRGPLSAFSSPTPIQAAAWPSLFAGRDVVGVAETGSGKTIAFGLPCIRYLAQHPSKGKKSELRACVVSPTRELAMQIYDQLVKLADPAGFSVAVVYGGVPKDQQREALKTASIVVATPGRLNDLINEEAANLGSVGYLVLDEADRMLDKGFEHDIKRIISFTRQSGRQTLMFTATWPESVRDLASTFMQDPVKISIGDNPTGELRANTRITQIVQVVEQHDKQFKLLQLLKEHQSGAKKNDRILVFCLYKKEASRIELFVRNKGLKVAGIHGDMSQPQRTQNLDAFKQGQVSILVATDVAARGLDIPAVKVVINVTFPLTAEDYVHRIGRYATLSVSS